MIQTKICFITDIHLPVEGTLANNSDTRSNFIDIIKSVKDESPEHLIVAGDICFRQPEREVYRWAKTILDNSGLKYSVISGNHDDSGMLRTYIHPELPFNADNNEIYYVKYISGHRFIFLDTAIGEMSFTQWQWLTNELDAVDDKSVSIVMHHPPVIAGVPHMDNRYSFKEMVKFQDLLKNYDFEINVFTGHYHVERTIMFQNINVFITPSCFVQIDDRYEEFVADHYVVGYRNIIIGDNYFSTNVKYLM